MGVEKKVLGQIMQYGWKCFPCVRFQGKQFNITGIQVYAPTSNAEEAEVEQFYEDLQIF